MSKLEVLFSLVQKKIKLLVTDHLLSPVICPASYSPPCRNMKKVFHCPFLLQHCLYPQWLLCGGEDKLEGPLRLHAQSGDWIPRYQLHGGSSANWARFWAVQLYGQAISSYTAVPLPDLPTACWRRRTDPLNILVHFHLLVQQNPWPRVLVLKEAPWDPWEHCSRGRLGHQKDSRRISKTPGSVSRTLGTHYPRCLAHTLFPLCQL